MSLKTLTLLSLYPVSKRIAAKAIELGVTKVVFDRNGFLYHGRVKSLAESAREGGLQF
jgi:large subunit ribosomal protein L18